MVDGTVYKHVSGKLSAQQAVAFIHQDLGLIEWMSVAENIARAVGYPRSFGRIDWAAVEADFQPTARVASLTRAEKSLVAIARALAVECDLLVLDDPTASLPADEVVGPLAALRPLKAKGVGMIYVAHRRDKVFQIADRVAVLRHGQMVGMRDIEHTNAEDLVSLIVDRKTREIDRPEVQEGTKQLAVTGLRTHKAGPVSFTIKQGEMVGLVGLRGAGHEEIGRALFGLEAHSAQVVLEGAVPDLTNPRTAMASGIGFVARDRVVESVAPSLTIRENTCLNRSATGRGLTSFLWPRDEDALARNLGGAGRAVAQ